MMRARQFWIHCSWWILYEETPNKQEFPEWSRELTIPQAMDLLLSSSLQVNTEWFDVIAKTPTLIWVNAMVKLINMIRLASISQNLSHSLSIPHLTIFSPLIDCNIHVNDPVFCVDGTQPCGLREAISMVWPFYWFEALRYSLLVTSHRLP